MSVALTGAISSQIIGQVRQMGSWLGPNLMPDISSIISGLAAITTITFFLYTFEHKGILGGIAKTGRIFIMCAFGAIMGTFLMGNLATSIAQIPNLVTGYGTYVTAVAVLLIMIDVLSSRRKRKLSTSGT
jgi:hypothetical protein